MDSSERELVGKFIKYKYPGLYNGIGYTYLVFTLLLVFGLVSVLWADDWWRYAIAGGTMLLFFHLSLIILLLPYYKIKMDEEAKKAKQIGKVPEWVFEEL